MSVASRRVRAEAGDGQPMREQLAELLAIIQRQEARIEQQQQQIEQQQAQMVTLSERLSAQAKPTSISRVRSHRTTGRTTNRRALLKWGGAAAAAATVAVVAGQEQSVRAAHATDNASLVVGQTNTATTETQLQATSSSTADPLLLVDNSLGSGSMAFQAIGYNTAVYGSGTVTGVYGLSDIGYGVVGLAYFGIDIAAVGTGRFWQFTLDRVGPPIAGEYFAGEQVRDANGDLWLCIAGNGTDEGTWVRAAHVPNGYTGGAIAYLSKPTRLLDTRGESPSAVQNGGGKISSGTPFTLQVAGVTNSHDGVSIPSSAVGAIGKVTVISYSGGAGFVAIVPSGSGTPTTGTLPYGDSQTLATAFNVGLGGSPGSINIYVGGTAVDVVIDLFAVVA